MDLEDTFEIPESKRKIFIKDNILAKLPPVNLHEAGEKVVGIINKYAGQDLNALSVLAYAAEQNRFEEFVGKLESHYQESLQFVHPDARKLVVIPGAVRVERFFVDCYKAMGIGSE